MLSGSCLVSGSIADLHASLSSELLSLRHAAILSALGMNALQSLSTSGVQASCCSGVPCEKQSAGEAVADSKASDTHKRASGIRRGSVHLQLSMFIRGLMADIDTLSPEPALVAKRQGL
jgi:hypothetical protein